MSVAVGMSGFSSGLQLATSSVIIEGSTTETNLLTTLALHRDDQDLIVQIERTQSRS